MISVEWSVYMYNPSVKIEHEVIFMLWFIL
jgi:hypothetical protein